MPPCTCTPSEATSFPMSVENALATGVSSEARSWAARRAASSPLRFAGSRARAVRAVGCDGGGIGESARGAGERAHGEQHALDVGMRDDRARASFHAGCAALFALAGISERLLGRALGDGDALQRDRQAGLVHH